MHVWQWLPPSEGGGGQEDVGGHTALLEAQAPHLQLEEKVRHIALVDFLLGNKNVNRAML